MPSTSSIHRLLTVLFLACICANPATAAVADPYPSSTTSGCFPSVDRVEQGEAVGDVVELEMLLCFSGSVHVTGPGYEGNATLGDGTQSGHITLQLNTYRNGTGAFGVTSSALGSVQMNAKGNGSFQPGNYTVTLRDGSGDVVQTVSFELGEPRAQNLSVFRAPRGAAADLQTVEAVREVRLVSQEDSYRRFDDANSSQHLPLATNETLVVALRVDGLEGAMTADDGAPLTWFRTAINETGAALATRQTSETVTPERRPLTPDILNSSGTHLVADSVNDTYYLVVDTRELWGEWGGKHGHPVHIGSHEGAGYAVRFSMQGAISEYDPPTDLVAADIRVVEAAVRVSRLTGADSDIPAVLAPQQDARLPVESTMAPGTMLTVRVAGLPDGPIEETVHVARLSTGPGFELPLNLSGVQNGTTLTLTVQRGSDTLDDQLEAVVWTPQATLDVRSQPSSSSLRVDSVTVSHQSIVAVYAGNGSLVGTSAVAPGSTEDLSVPLRTNTTGMYRVVLYQDLDRSGTLTTADEAYQRNGSDVAVTVDVRDFEPTPTETDTPTETTTETATTTTQSPGFGVLAGLLGLLIAALTVRQSEV